MRKNLLRSLFALVVIGGMASPALARRDEPEHDIVDARLEGVEKGRNVTLEGGSTGMTYAFFVVLSAIALVALFKDAKRSHLD